MTEKIVTYSIDKTTSDWSSFHYDYETAIRLAFNQWDDATKIEFVRVSGDADITVGTGDLHEYGAGAAGLTAKMDSTTRVDALIKIGTNLWYPQNAAWAMTDTALHEIGHALGLEHSDQTGDIMYPVLPAAPQVLSAHDVSLADSVWGADTGNASILASNIGLVTAVYKAGLDRAPDAGGFVWFTHGLEDGTIDTTRMASIFVNSDEFGVKTNSQFVDALYENTLDRAPDQSGHDYWTGALDNHSITREQALLGFAGSVESHDNMASLYSTKMWYEV